jgi:hypothetical protein
MIRSTASDYGVLDKVTFIEYTSLPGIINDRLFCLFSSSLKDLKLTPKTFFSQTNLNASLDATN